MKRFWILIPAAAAAILLDSFLFPNLSHNGIRPLFVLAAALAAVASTKVQDGILIALIGGLLTDLFTNPYLGLSAAAYLLAVVILYGFVRKNRPKLPLLFVFTLIGWAVLAMFSTGEPWKDFLMLFVGFAVIFYGGREILELWEDYC